MAFFDEVFKGKVVTGLAIGIGAAVLAPKVLPILAEAIRPLAKGAIKGGLLCIEKGKEVAAELTEVTEDIWAEAQAELAEEHAAVPVAEGDAGAPAKGEGGA